MSQPVDANQLLTALHATSREVSTRPPADSDRTQAANQVKFDEHHARWGSMKWSADLTDDEVWHRICFIPFFAGVKPVPDIRVKRTVEYIGNYREVGVPGWLESERGKAYLAEADAYEAYSAARKRDKTMEPKAFAFWVDKDGGKGPVIIKAAQKLLKRQNERGKPLLELLVPEGYREFTDDDLTSIFTAFRAETEYPFITAFHALMDLGVPVVKPDRMLVRTVVRLGLIDADPHLPHHTGLKVTTDHANDLGQKPAFVWPLQKIMRGIASDTGKNLREVDWLFAKMGMKPKEDEGREFPVCDEVPMCERCYARPICAYAAKFKPMPVFKQLKKGKSKSRRIKVREPA